MKKNEKGLTLIELIFSIVLLTIILFFLYILINNILFKESNNEFDSSVSSALIVENINEDLVKYGLAYVENINETYKVNKLADYYNITFRTINGTSKLEIKQEENNYKVSYVDTVGKEYIWDLDENLYVNFDNIKDEKIEVENDPNGNIILKLDVPIYSKEGTLNTEEKNDYKDDIIIEYYGKMKKITQIPDEDIVEITAPVITSSDGLLSGEVHTSNFTLTASGSEEGTKYYWIEGEVTEGASITIKSETTGKKYSVKACNEKMQCSEESSYIVVYKKEVIPIPPVKPDTPSIVSSDGITSGRTHTSNFYLNVSNPKSDLTYYWSGGTSTTGTSIYVSTETNGTVYYLKACNSDNVCSDTALYTVVLKKDIGGSSGGGGNSGGGNSGGGGSTGGGSSGGGGEIVVAPPSAPTITASDNISSGSWHKSTFKLKASSSGATSYKWSGGSTSTSSSISVTANTSGTTYRVQACNSGGCSKEKTYTVKLDTSAPTCTMSYHKSSATGDTYSSGWTKYTVYIVFSSCKDNLTKASSLTKGVTSNTGSVVISGNTRYISKEGTHTITATVKDAAGNKSTYKKTIKIDKTAPACTLYTTTGDYHSNGGTSGSTSTSAVYVELSCKDSVSGMNTTKLVKSYDGTTYTSKMKMTKSGTASYTATDVVGHKTTGSKSVTIKTCTTSTSYTTSCTPSSTVTCSGSYTKKTTYTAKSSSTSYKWVKSGTYSGTSAPVSSSCQTASDLGHYKYSGKTCISCVRGGTKYAPKCTTPSNNRCNKWTWDRYVCQKGSTTYSNYSSSSTYVTAGNCTKSGSSGTSKTYVTCTTGYKLKTVTKCS